MPLYLTAAPAVTIATRSKKETESELRVTINVYSCQVIDEAIPGRISESPSRSQFASVASQKYNEKNTELIDLVVHSVLDVRTVARLRREQAALAEAEAVKTALKATLKATSGNSGQVSLREADSDDEMDSDNEEKDSKYAAKKEKEKDGREGEALGAEKEREQSGAEWHFPIGSRIFQGSSQV